MKHVTDYLKMVAFVAGLYVYGRVMYVSGYLSAEITDAFKK